MKPLILLLAIQFGSAHASDLPLIKHLSCNKSDPTIVSMKNIGEDKNSASIRLEGVDYKLSSNLKIEVHTDLDEQEKVSLVTPVTQKSTGETYQLQVDVHYYWYMDKKAELNAVVSLIQEGQTLNIKVLKCVAVYR